MDAKGNLWVQEYETRDESEPQWSVFDTEGVLQGTLSVPTGVTLTDIGDDYVLGHWRDDLDVEHVRMYALVKPRQRTRSGRAQQRCNCGRSFLIFRSSMAGPCFRVENQAIQGTISSRFGSVRRRSGGSPCPPHVIKSRSK